MWAALAKVALFLATFAGMEAFAYFTHRYVMHGALWCWHRSHHEPRSGLFELNDLFAVVFALPAILAIWLGVNVDPWWLPVGLGVTAYGASYFLFHDGLVHRRFALPIHGRDPFWRPRIQAHRLHHAVSTKTGCVSFGFLWAAPPRELKRRLTALRRT
jgi:beta-carotene 3-hydroxylase